MPAIPTIEESLLVTSLKQGDKLAFAGIYNKYHRQIYVIALKYLKDEALAQDIVQEIFIKLWTYREHLKEELSLKGFLITSVHNLVLNTIRNRQTEILKHIELVHKTNNSPKLSDHALLVSEYARIAEKGISELSPAKQLIFRLRSFHCLSNQEVAAQLGLSVNTVKFQFSQASKTIRQYLKDHAGI